jgi:hypothetical protein
MNVRGTAKKPKKANAARSTIPATLSGRAKGGTDAWNEAAARSFQNEAVFRPS